MENLHKVSFWIEGTGWDFLYGGVVVVASVVLGVIVYKYLT